MALDMSGLVVSVLLAVFQADFTNCQKVPMNVMKDCCNKGEEQASVLYSTRCSAAEFNVANIKDHEKEVCLRFWTQCCEARRTKQHCEKGEARARETARCSQGSIVGSSACTKDERRCCDCCRFGLRLGIEKYNCNVMAGMATACSGITMKCCIDVKKNTTLQGIATGSFQAAIKGSTTCKVANCEQLCTESQQGAVCSCRLGYKLTSNGKTCQDIDECQQNAAQCPADQRCVNANGSYKCVGQTSTGNCPAGYRYKQSVCEDINECLEDPSICGANGKCVNWPGKYYCSCNRGFSLNQTSKTCIDVDECKLNSVLCPSSQDCVNTVGGYKCVIKTITCTKGFTPDSTGKRCIALRTCDKKPCDHICTDLDRGNYRCACRDGFELGDNGRSCVLKQDPCDSQPCRWRCEAQGTNGFKCLCPPGYKLAADKRNCQVSSPCDDNPCEYRCQRLSPTVYRCTCPSGKELKADRKTCQDIDPCRNNGCQYRCVALSDRVYQCKCPNGQELRADLKTCQDINPCRNHNCEYRCDVINDRLYQCKCPPGQELRADRRSCHDIDPCRNHNCQYQCKVVSDRVYQCQCPQGQELLSDRRSCRVIDPCRDAKCKYRCRAVGDRTYQCYCPSGQELMGDLISCQDIDPCRNKPCQHRCTPINLRMFRCSCPKGQALNDDLKTCRVVPPKDPCSPSPCQWRCQDLGNERFQCQCPPGYSLQSNGRTCKDVDECATQLKRCGYGSACFNTWGSYRCIDNSCPVEYFQKSANRDRFCAKNCYSTDMQCLNDPRHSYQWLPSVQPNGMAAGSLEYYYEMRPTSYPVNVQFSIASGNGGQEFYLQRSGSYKVLLKNRKQLVGPKDHKIVLHTDVYRDGKLRWRLVNVFYIYVSAYNFR